ncbi:hypothetical protein ACF0H5_004501 [Mactra antiquata]
MSEPNGKIRILVCTNAAGMGVNFRNVKHVVHFGPAHDIDTFVQQVGRAGRNGENADHLLLCTPRQINFVSKELQLYCRNSDQCRRKVLLENYVDINYSNVVGHKCCDLCAMKCLCGETDCHSSIYNHSAFLLIDSAPDSDDESSDDDSESYELCNSEDNLTDIDCDFL